MKLRISLKKPFADMKEFFGEDRNISVCRELTKIYEETLIFTLKTACEYYETHEPKGEFVLVIEGKSDKDRNQI